MASSKIEFESNDVVQHFKGNLYVIITTHAIHTETGERLVIYMLYKGKDTNFFARPYDMFMSEVDKEKYPNVNQKYRFERLKNNIC